MVRNAHRVVRGERDGGTALYGAAWVAATSLGRDLWTERLVLASTVIFAVFCAGRSAPLSYPRQRRVKATTR